MYLSIDERCSRLTSGALLGTIACRSRRRGRMFALGRQVDGLLTTQSSRSTGDSADIEPDRAAQRWFACAPEFGSHQAAKPRTDQAILAKERGPSGRPLRYAVRTAAFSRSSPCWATSAARLP